MLSSLEIGELLQIVDIVKRTLVGEGHFDRLVARVPRANFALAGDG